jgi:hypothetical protein
LATLKTWNPARGKKELSPVKSAAFRFGIRLIEQMMRIIKQSSGQVACAVGTLSYGYVVNLTCAQHTQQAMIYVMRHLSEGENILKKSVKETGVT